MKNLFNQFKLCILVAVVALVVGFFAGRGKTTTTTTIEYVKGETIHDSVPKPYPVINYTPQNPILPTKPDTIKINNTEYHVLKVDTAQIIKNYIVKHNYTITAFDNKNGKLIIKPVVQYNELQSIPYEFTPITQVNTIMQERLFTPFVVVSYNSLGFVGVGGGVFIKNVGVGAKYITDFEKKGFEVSGSVKF